MTDFNKKLKEIEIIMKSISDNNDLDKKIELYEEGKKKCDILENIFNEKKDIINNINISNQNFKIKNDKNIFNLFNKIKELETNFDNENITFDKLEDYYKKAFIIKEQSQQYSKDKNLHINMI